MTDQTEHTGAEEVIAHLDDVRLGQYACDIELSSSAENHVLATHMLSQARRVLRIFTRELDPPIYDQSDFLEASKQLALRGRFSSIEILTFDSQQIAQRGHRLVDLSRSISSHIQIRRPEKEYESHLETFMTVDGTGYLYRKNAQRFEGIANFNHPREVRKLDKLFAEIWEHSHVDTEMRQLNI